MSEFYNNKDEQKISNLIADLKKLPKVEAPENFEFNLMTRIQNENFGQAEEVRPRFNLLKFLAPSAAVLATVVLFFIFYPQQQDIQTQIAEKQSITDTPSIAGNSADKNVESLFSVPQKSTSPEVKSQRPSNIQSVEQNYKPAKQTIEFNPRKSVSVDDYISGANTSPNSGTRNSVVNVGERAIADGFFVEKKADQKTIEKYRHELDSLKKALLKADSLKKARK
ncbi:MAG: hypothetical protein FD143_641 [Ignavibacteria bacterium]|nr:MAG: hypothetical protein FD143_641 [Ignavibacteria bacterium]KAF0161471.1 MAG: hypothetical protein FD188_842 [Ignavibacteria bacterium]